MTPFTAELLGTMLLILLGNGVVANTLLEGTKGHASGWIVITTGWAMAVFVGVVVAGPFSGAHLNPAVTVALAITGKFAWEAVPGYVLAQMIGAMLGAFLVWLTHKDHFAATRNEASKLACFATGPAIRKPLSNLISESVGTFVLVFTVLFLVGPTLDLGDEREVAIGLGSIGALPVALLVWVIGLSLGGTTGYAINPARDLGPRIMHTVMRIGGLSDWGYAWVPVVGPLLGAAVAAWLYLWLR
ncbi:MAG: aquaporin family protein [Flavobacteriales bacterium]|nr:aquaporin family protein [Flavobacteriales bacterium]